MKLSLRPVPRLNTPPADWLKAVSIRFAQAYDLAALEWDGEFTHFRRIYVQAYQRMIKGLGLIWVAELPKTGLIGQLFIQLVCDRPELADGLDRAYMYSFRIKPPFRGQGLGSTMMARVEGDLSRRGYKYMTLNVAKENSRAQHLYHRLGYSVVAHEPGIWSYVDDQGRVHDMIEPAWRMEKRIDLT